MLVLVLLLAIALGLPGTVGAVTADNDPNSAASGGLPSLPHPPRRRILKSTTVTVSEKGRRRREQAAEDDDGRTDLDVLIVVTSDAEAESRRKNDNEPPPGTKDGEEEDSDDDDDDDEEEEEQLEELGLIRIMALVETEEALQALRDFAVTVHHEIYDVAVAVEVSPFEGGGVVSSPLELAGEGIIAAVIDKADLEELRGTEGVSSVEMDARMVALTVSLPADGEEDATGRRRRRRHRYLQSAQNSSEVVPPGVSIVQADLLEAGEFLPRVCVVDTGYAIAHRDLPSERKREVDGRSVVQQFTGDIWQWDGDLNGHGTHNAGILAAIPDNGIGVRGILQVGGDRATPQDGADLFIIPGLDHRGWGRMSDALAAVRDCVDHGANVISLGMGCSAADPDNPGCRSEIAERFLNRTVMTFGDVMIVAPAGNDGASSAGTEHFPSSFDSVISATAVAENPDDGSLRPADFAVRDADLAGPGVGILSTYVYDDGTYGYEKMTGTSHASSHVAGVAALVWSRFPKCEAQDVWEALLASALQVGAGVIGGEEGGAVGTETNGTVPNATEPDERRKLLEDRAVRLVQAKDAFEYLENKGCTPRLGSQGEDPIEPHKRGVDDEDGPWPGCEGMTVDLCLFFIRETGFQGKVVKVSEGDANTLEYDSTRVQIVYNETGYVSNTPFIG